MRFLRAVGLFFKECILLIKLGGIKLFKASYRAIHTFCRACGFADKQKRYDIVASVFLGFLLTIFFIWLVHTTGLIAESKDRIEKLALLGDSFGWLTSLFAGLSAFLVFLTLSAQKRELHETRTLMQYQRIEATVFQLLEGLQSTLSEIQIHNQGQTYSGRAAFKSFYEDLKLKFVAAFGSTNDGFGGFKMTETAETACQKEKELIELSMEKAWNNLWGSHGLWLGHYYRQLYRIVKFIDQSMLLEESKQELVKIVRAQISNYELVLLYYNLKSQEGEKFRLYCDKYEILKHIPKEMLICKEIMKP